jgi:hypothetical protein
VLLPWNPETIPSSLGEGWGSWREQGAIIISGQPIWDHHSATFLDSLCWLQRKRVCFHRILSRQNCRWRIEERTGLTQTITLAHCTLKP